MPSKLSHFLQRRLFFNDRASGSPEDPAERWIDDWIRLALRRWIQRAAAPLPNWEQIRKAEQLYENRS